MSVKKKILSLIAIGLGNICHYTHWMNPILVMMGLPHCLPTLWSFRLDEKFDLGLFKVVDIDKLEDKDNEII
ncbi:MAG TPA: hypothetical protein ENJ28_11275 [Gammaproteobacteria bacterium]|nr:hypothetical protein [Gammaproteobacteria bacterium]